MSINPMLHQLLVEVTCTKNAERLNRAHALTLWARTLESDQ